MLEFRYTNADTIDVDLGRSLGLEDYVQEITLLILGGLGIAHRNPDEQGTFVWMGLNRAAGLLGKLSVRRTHSDNDTTIAS